MNRSVSSVLVAFLVLLVALLCGGPWMRAMTVTSAGLDEAIAKAEAERVRDTLSEMDPDTRSEIMDRCALQVLRCTPATCGRDWDAVRPWIDPEAIAGRTPTAAERRKLTALVEACVRRDEAGAGPRVAGLTVTPDDAGEEPVNAEPPLWLMAVAAGGSCAASLALLGVVGAMLLGRGGSR